VLTCACGFAFVLVDCDAKIARITVRRLIAGYGTGKVTVQPALTNALGCVLVQGAPSSLRYVKTKPFGGSGRSEFVHRISYKATHGDGCFKGHEKEDVGHRCHQMRCIRPSHLQLVTRKVNQSMNGCAKWFLNDDGSNPCQHNPQCILPDKGVDRATTSALDVESVAREFPFDILEPVD
jgi:hypothetical protein